MLDMRKKMATMRIVVLAILPMCIFSASYDPLKIQQPSIALETKENGFVGIASGDFGDVHIDVKDNVSSIYFDGVDLLYIIEVIESRPPVWEAHGPVLDKTPYGYLGEFHAGDTVNLVLSAVDPEGMAITYTRVAGELPPGIRLDTPTGKITGIIPDADATYSFTVRATDGHGKYADHVFRMVIKGYDGCSSNPCQNEGLCTDEHGGLTCDCVRPYGGRTCNLNCRTNPLGIQNSLKYVPDASLTAYKVWRTYYATDGRLDGSGCILEDGESYMQIDFGNTTDIYGITTQAYSTSYYFQYYYLQYSVDGQTFHNFTDYTGTTTRFSGSTSTSHVHRDFSALMTTRFVRVFPLTWNRSYRPGVRLEMFGCYRYD